MGKLPNVTVEELRAVDSTGSDLLYDVVDLNNRIEKGYVDDVEKPIELVRSLLATSRGLAELAAKLLFKAAMQEDKAELTKLLAERQALEK